MEKVDSFMLKVMSIKETGDLIKHMVKVFIHILTVPNILDLFSMINNMVLA
jgi:hypothetical protein